MAVKPEDRARERIDQMLSAAGWLVQNASEVDLTEGLGIAVRELKLKPGHGFADYILYVDRKVCGVIEAKKEGETLTGVELQTEKYSAGLPDSLPAYFRPLPFLYQSTGVETCFTNYFEPEPRSRFVFQFHRPETFLDWLAPATRVTSTPHAAQRSRPYGTPDTFLRRLQNMPPLEERGMWDPQIVAVKNVERSLAQGRPRSLIQMQMGSGKTFTAISLIYRLIKFGGARRVLFLVDRANLGKQTLAEFTQYTTPDDGRKFTELYNVQRLESNKIDPVSRVCITTIQRLYSILQGEEEFEGDEEQSVAGLEKLRKQPLPVVYNPKIPIETFDIVITDECHRSIYNLWRQVLEYFDAQLIGLTATPSKQTLGFFNQNLVMEYGHSQAVADGVNVDFDVYTIQTKITQQGSKVDAGYWVDKRDRKSRRLRWQELEQDLNYTPNELDRAVVAVDQIRTVVQTFRDRLFTEIFPGRTEVPKTLIFAKDDSHADDIVRIIREEFGKGNDFCQKITYRTSTMKVENKETGAITYKSSGIKPEEFLESFRTSYYPRIAVTVDMIATGTNVKPLEIVFFMRDVRSANYFEQMKGRGSRVVTKDELNLVTPDASGKSRYVIVDAVGVTSHEKADSVTLDRKPSVSTELILKHVGQGGTDPEIISTLGSRLARLERKLSEGQRKGIEQVCGMSLHELTHNLLDSVDPDVIESRILSQDPSADLDDRSLVEDYSRQMREKAIEPLLRAKFREAILNAMEDSEQTLDTVSKDEVIFAGHDAQAKERAQAMTKSFREYIEQNKDEITALQVLYSRPKGKAPSFQQLQELAQSIQRPPHQWTPEALWQAYKTLEESKVKGAGRRMVTDMISLVRFALQQETILAPFAETVDDRFARWLDGQQASGREFTVDQLQWLAMIKDHIATSVSISQNDFDYLPFSERGGLGKAYDIFGSQLPQLLSELSEVLAA